MRAPEENIDPDQIPTQRGTRPAAPWLYPNGLTPQQQIDVDWMNEANRDAARDAANRPVDGVNLGSRPLGVGMADPIDGVNLGMRPLGLSAALADPTSPVYSGTAQYARSVYDAWRQESGQARRDAYAAAGMPSLGMGLPSQDINQATLLTSPTAYLVQKPAIAALGAVDYVWENVVAEPASTLAIVSNPNSDAFGDWELARERANEVSFGQAVLANPMSGISFIAATAFGVGPWADADVDYTDPAVVKAMSDEYTSYNIMTGSVDFALNVAPAPGMGPVRAAAGVLGLTTRVSKANQLITLADDIARGLRFRATSGAEGQLTRTFTLLEEMAKTSDAGLLLENPLIRGITGAPQAKLAYMAEKTSDVELLGQMYLASVGDMRAAATLVNMAPDAAYSLGRLGPKFQMKYQSANWKLTPEQELMRERAFASAIDRDEFVRVAIDTFFSGGNANEFRVLGDFMPMRGISTVDNPIMQTISKIVAKPIAAAVEQGRYSAYRTQAAINTGNTEYLPGIMEKVISTSPDGPVVRLINIPFGALRWSLSQRPLQALVFSGTRPDDVIKEFYAAISQVKELSAGRTFPHPTRRVVDENGYSVPAEVDTAELVREWTNQLVKALSSASEAGAAGKRVIAAWRRIEDDVIKGLARQHGVNDTNAALLVQQIRERASFAWGNLKTKGSFGNELEEQVIFHPEVIAQLADHEYTIPLSEVASNFRDADDILRHGSSEFGQTLVSLFEGAQTIWRSNMLLKPGYTFRNSMLEPWVSTAISQLPMIFSAPGAMEFGRGMINFTINNARRVRRVTAGSVDAIGAARLRKQFDVARDRYVAASVRRDQLQAELDSYGGFDAPSIQLKKQEAAADLLYVEKELEFLSKYVMDAGGDADDLLMFQRHTYTGVKSAVDDIRDAARGVNSKGRLAAVEQELADAQARLAAKPDDVRVAARVDALEERVSVMRTFAAMAADPAKADELAEVLKMVNSLDSRLGQINKILSYDPDEALDALGKIRKELDTATKNFAEVRLSQAAVSTRRQKRRTPRLQGGGVKTKTIYGKDVEFPELFSGPHGEAYRAEASSAQTVRSTFDPTGGIHRRVQIGNVPHTASNYMDEIYYVAKRYINPDQLFRLMLEKPREEVLAWIKSPDGQQYVKLLGKKGKEYDETELNAAYDVLNSLFPTPEARALLARNEDFTAGELAEALLKPLPDGSLAKLKDIEGQELIPIIKGTTMDRFRGMFRRALEGAWEYIAVQPETRLARWPWYARQFEAEWTSRMSILAEQGYDIVDINVANAQRQVSRRAALGKLEKTFYNIRRQRNSIYALRWVSSFPAAFFNSLYRYLWYLPTRHPGNMLAMVNTTNATFSSLAVDAEGNKVPLSEAEFLVIPMTGDGTKQDPGVRVPLDALTRIFVDNPGRSWLMAIGIDTGANFKPDWFEYLNQNLPGGLGDFLLGEFRSPAQGDIWDVTSNVMLSGWQKTIVQWLRGEGSEEYKMYQAWAWQDADAQRAKQRAALEAAGEPIPEWLQGPPDYDRDVAPRLNGWFTTRLTTQFFSPVAYKTDAPGQLERDTWRRIQDENPGLSFLDLREKYFQVMGGDWVDPFTASTTKDPYNLDGNYSLEALDTLGTHSALAKTLGEMDPSLVALLLVGDAGTYSKAVMNNLRQNGPYPGADPMNVRMDLEELRQKWFVDAGWDEYNREKERYINARAIAELEPDAKKRAELRRRANYWWDFFLNNTDESAGPLGLTERNAYWQNARTQGTNTETVINGLKTVMADAAFWAEKKDDPSWQMISYMLDKREELSDIKKRMNSEWLDARGIDMTVDDYNRWLTTKYMNYFAEQAMIPELAGFRDLWDRYFADEYVTDSFEAKRIAEAQQ